MRTNETGRAGRPSGHSSRKSSRQTSLGGALVIVASREDRKDDGSQENAGNHQQGSGGGYIELEPARWPVVGIDQHFNAHEDQHKGQAVFQVAEIANGSG